MLRFYSYGIMLEKWDGNRLTEYPVDPAHVALALSAKVGFDTGLLVENTLLVRYEGVKKTVVEYRPPGKTGLYFEGSETPLRVPLPGMLMIRVTSEDKSPQYQVYAVKQRPDKLDTLLFHVPLPNVFTSGSICWGSVPVASETALKGSSLVEDWAVFLGSRFGDHGCNGKSKSHPQDIRQKLIQLEQRKARIYPKSDLIPAKRTLAQALGDERP
ncbi:MAG: prokaryotic E2 ligase family D protein [Anaerolineae bacterium]|nr:prokaryotic E2 ligase family D protein [Anaerolineae bacterium]